VLARRPGAARRWTGWTDRTCSPTVVLLAAVVVATGCLAVWADLLWRPWGGPGLTLALPSAVLVVSLLGWERVCRAARELRVWWESLAVLGALLLATGAVFVAGPGTTFELAALGIGALEEELVFRFAAPLALGGLTAWTLGRPPGDVRAWGDGPRAVAVVGAAAVFTAMPGHLEQMSSPLHALPFAALAMLLTYTVLRTGAVVPGVAAHALLNIATVAYLQGSIPRGLWSALVVAGLGTYAWGADRAGRRLGALT
jgi:membrane protease YdiL (CAAX protease family)